MLNHTDITPPASLPGLQDFHVYWEPRWKCHTVKIKPGEFYVSDKSLVIGTVLGSCISACIYDSTLGIGGMNHFMLPSTGTERDQERSLRYGLYAMEQLINELLKQGCSYDNLKIKLTGGGDMLPGMRSIGKQNIRFILNYINDEDLKLISSDLGGHQARRVAFFPAEGRMLVSKLSKLNDQIILKEERSYSQNVDRLLDDSDIEIF